MEISFQFCQIKYETKRYLVYDIIESVRKPILISSINALPLELRILAKHQTESGLYIFFIFPILFLFAHHNSHTETTQHIT